MSDHDPERDSAAYVTGVMTPDERERFETHLLTCETCWTEVRLDREGQRLAESAREPAPADLRATVRAAVFAEVPDRRVASPLRPGRWSATLRGITAAAAVLVLVVAALVSRSGTASVVEAAMAAYEQSAVEAHHEPMPAPDLSSLGMRSVGAAHMALADMRVEGFAYRTGGGNSLALFMADRAFPMPLGATTSANGWHLSRGDLTLLCGDQPVPFLVVTSDAHLMEQLSQALDAGSIRLA